MNQKNSRRLELSISRKKHPHGRLATRFSKGIAKGGVKNRNKGGWKRLFAFVHVCSRLLAFACVFASAFACVCRRLSAFVCVCLRLLAFAYAPLCCAPLCLWTLVLGSVDPRFPAGLPFPESEVLEFLAFRDSGKLFQQFSWNFPWNFPAELSELSEYGFVYGSKL